MADSTESTEVLTSRVHLVEVTPWRQAAECFFNPDDDVEIDDLSFRYPDAWSAGDLLS